LPARAITWLGSVACDLLPGPVMRGIEPLLQETVSRGASDLHVSMGSPPMIRLHGELVALEHPPLGRAETRTLCYGVLADAQRRRFEAERELDFAVAIPGLGRFRGNLHLTRGTIGGAFRVIPQSIPDLAGLGLPPVVASLALLPRGLVLVTGPTGSGKSTTLAALIDQVNRARRDHIVSLEDPVEFLHEPKRCLVTQREVESDTAGFAPALKQVLRQDPDVVLVGEMRDRETIEAALTVAETGHLVLSTLHTGSAVQTLTRIIDVFPPYQQSQVRAQLSLALQAVVAQQLVRRRDGTGRVLAVEVMLATPAIRNLLRDEKIHQVYSQMQVGHAGTGMQTMSRALVGLVERGLVATEDAIVRATEPDELRHLLGGTAHVAGA
jgi:twitching motility protein PilT